jgi:hypothetical protein
VNVHEVFTAESLAEFERRTAEADGRGQQLLAQYRQDHGNQLRDAPDLHAWIDALKDGDLDVAKDAALWSRLAEQGFIEVPAVRASHPDHGVFRFRIVSAKVFDGFRGPGGPRADYAFTTVRVCLRRESVPSTVTVPEDWRAPVLIDTELFELPADVSDDMFDDREKIHLIYLAGTKDGRFVCKPVYIGVGTGGSLRHGAAAPHV